MGADRFETNKRNTKENHVSNENTFTNLLTLKQLSYVPYNVNWKVLQKTHFKLTKMHF
jgi:hypothetical protein